MTLNMIPKGDTINDVLSRLRLTLSSS